MEIRSEIEKFAEVMETKMRKMDDVKSDSWKDVNLPRLRGGLSLEIEEWKRTLNEEEGNNINEENEELVDIANFCCMVFSRNKLDEKTEE